MVIIGTLSLALAFLSVKVSPQPTQTLHPEYEDLPSYDDVVPPLYEDS